MGSYDDYEENQIERAGHHIEIKIQGGTIRSGKSLCRSCRFGKITEGFNGGQKIVHCNQLERDLKWEVARCSEYEDAATPSLYDMQGIAWMLVTHKDRKTIGFIRKDEWDLVKKEERRGRESKYKTTD